MAPLSDHDIDALFGDPEDDNEKTLVNASDTEATTTNSMYPESKSPQTSEGSNGSTMDGEPVVPAVKTSLITHGDSIEPEKSPEAQPTPQAGTKRKLASDDDGSEPRKRR